jgi:phage-related protein
MSTSRDNPKPLLWVGSTKKDLLAMPGDVQDTFGYALHCFQKKSSSGIATPKPDMDLMRERLKAALAHAGM